MLWKKNSKCVIQHIQKCLKSAFSKNEGVKTGMEESLRAIVPHQFLDFSYHPRFCGIKRKQQEIYIRRGLPYKTSFKDNHLRFQLDKQSWNQSLTMQCNAMQLKMADLGSSQ